jgi:hypothetical protein
MGVLCVLFLRFLPLVGVGTTVGFFVYEVMEDWRIKDKSYIDMRGWLIGAYVVGFILLMLHFVC